jgi:hypothetical protein
MKAPKRPRAGSFAVSLAIHAVVIVAFGGMVFSYPLGQLMSRTPKAQPERLQYVVVPPQAAPSSVSRAVRAATAAPAALANPRVVPTELPPPVDTAPSRAAGGTGTGAGVDGAGAVTGVVPRQPDARISLNTGPVARIPRTPGEAVDSIIDLAIGIYNDSMAIAARQRKPGDWGFKGKDGQVWGWDKEGIRLGKFTIPNALLALLPLNTAGGGSPIEARSLAYIRRDVLENAQRSISEDEFRAAVKRIRERKERERRQKLVASDSKSDPQ